MKVACRHCGKALHRDIYGHIDRKGRRVCIGNEHGYVIHEPMPEELRPGYGIWMETETIPSHPLGERLRELRAVTGPAEIAIVCAWIGLLAVFLLAVLHG